MKKFKTLLAILILACSTAALADGPAPKAPTISNEKMERQALALRILKENVPPQAFEKLTPEQTEKVLLAAIKNAGKQPDSPLDDAVQFGLVALFLFAVIGFPLYLKNRRAADFQRTLQLMIEKGVQIPDSLIENGIDGSRARRDLRRGVMLLALGGALVVSLLLAHSSAWAVGWIPMALGAGSLYLAQHGK